MNLMQHRCPSGEISTTMLLSLLECRSGWIYMGGRLAHSAGVQLQSNPSTCKWHCCGVAGGLLHAPPARGALPSSSLSSVAVCVASALVPWCSSCALSLLGLRHFDAQFTWSVCYCSCKCIFCCAVVSAQLLLLCACFTGRSHAHMDELLQARSRKVSEDVVSLRASGSTEELEERIMESDSATAHVGSSLPEDSTHLLPSASLESSPASPSKHQGEEILEGYMSLDMPI